METVNDLPILKNGDRTNDDDLGNFDFTSVVVPAEWIQDCNHKLEWNNPDMKSLKTRLMYSNLVFLSIILAGILLN